MGSKTACALVVMGVSGSGKSTIADHLAGRLGWRYEDGDRFHPASNVAKMSAVLKYIAGESRSDRPTLRR